MKEIKKGELGVVGRGESGGRVGPVCNQKRERESFFFFWGVWRERKREREREDFNIKTVRGIVKAS